MGREKKKGKILLGFGKRYMIELGWKDFISLNTSDMSLNI
jgi:hypothetical protein